MDFIKVYERIREGGMEAEWGTLNTPEDFVQRLSSYAKECVRAIRDVAAFVNSHPSLAEG